MDVQNHLMLIRIMDMLNYYLIFFIFQNQ